MSPEELGNLRFSFLTTGNPYNRYFSINAKTGVLSVASRLDRETVCSFRRDCRLTVSLVLGLVPTFSSLSLALKEMCVLVFVALDAFQCMTYEHLYLGVHIQTHTHSCTPACA